MEGIIIDELRIYRGEDYKVNDYLTIHIPTLAEICDYGESAYFSMVHFFVSTPADLLWQLDDMGIDYTTITDWELFYKILYRQFTPESTKILFGDFDFSKLKAYKNESDDVFLVAEFPKKNGDGFDIMTIDYYTYFVITEFLRKIHGFTKNEKRPANETTKRILIEDAKEEYMMNQKKEYHSYLKNLISAMVNSEGFKFNYMTVWDMNINAFLDSVNRIQKIKNATLILQSGYSGFGIDMKKISNKEIDWLGELR